MSLVDDLLDHNNNFRLVRGYPPRRLYVSFGEYAELLGHIKGPWYHTAKEYGMFDGAVCHPIRSRYVAKQIRAWDLS